MNMRKPLVQKPYMHLARLLICQIIENLNFFGEENDYK